MLKNLKPVLISGREVHPIIEGGKGIGVTDGATSGHFAAAEAVGTFSGVNASSYDEHGNVIEYKYQGKTRQERHHELLSMSIKGAITQAKKAYDIASGKGRLHMNMLWEAGGAEKILHGVFEKCSDIIHGVTCGAGMPYRLSEIAAKYNVYYYPIVSSMRAFRALWRRSYKKTVDLLGAVVYEDPWKAGGHNGLSNSEDPNTFEDPYPRVAELRKFMNEVGLNDVPIIMAGGVWHLNEWSHWLDNPEIGPIAFQFGVRPIVTTESPVPEDWKQRLLQLKEGDVFLNRFSPTGFYSSAVNNNFIKELRGRSERQIKFAINAEDEFTESIAFGKRGRQIYVTNNAKQQAQQWLANGYTELLKTPDNTVIFVTPDKAVEIHNDQVNCMGCLSHCKFSNWKDQAPFNTGSKADPRSFCIQKTLQHIVHEGDVDNQLMFSGHNAYRFATDPFYEGGKIPTTKALIDRMLTGY
ncbi:MAG: nitronate monooxygenase [Pseudomonadota bacterium]